MLATGGNNRTLRADGLRRGFTSSSCRAALILRMKEHLRVVGAAGCTQLPLPVVAVRTRKVLEDRHPTCSVLAADAAPAQERTLTHRDAALPTPGRTVQHGKAIGHASSPPPLDFGGRIELSGCRVPARGGVRAGPRAAPQRRSAAQVRGRAAAEPRTGVVIDLVKAAAPPTWLVSGRRRRCCSHKPIHAHLRARSSE